MSGPQQAAVAAYGNLDTSRCCPGVAVADAIAARR